MKKKSVMARGGMGTMKKPMARGGMGTKMKTMMAKGGSKTKRAKKKSVKKGKKRDWSDARPVSNIIDIPEQMSQWERKYYSPELLSEVLISL